MVAYEQIPNGKEAEYSPKNKAQKSSWIPIASAIWLLISIYPVFVFFSGQTSGESVRRGMLAPLVGD